MSKKVRFNYDLDRKGLGQVLGDLEIAVMEVLWRRGRSTVREIVGSLRRDRAYSSVITVANRLVRKGLVTREKEGKTYHYAPTLGREDLKELAARRILDRVAEIATPETVIHLIDSMAAGNPERLAELDKWIEAQKRRRRKG